MASDKAQRKTSKLITQLQEAGIQVPRQPSRRELDELMRENRDKLVGASS